MGRTIPFFFWFPVEFEFSTTNRYYPHNRKTSLPCLEFLCCKWLALWKTERWRVVYEKQKTCCKGMESSPCKSHISYVHKLWKTRRSVLGGEVRGLLFWVPRFPNVTPHSIVTRFSSFSHSSDSCCCFLVFKVAPHPAWSPPQGSNLRPWDGDLGWGSRLRCLTRWAPQAPLLFG